MRERAQDIFNECFLFILITFRYAFGYPHFNSGYPSQKHWEYIKSIIKSMYRFILILFKNLICFF